MMNKRDWHELGLRLIGCYFILDGLSLMAYTLCDRLADFNSMVKAAGGDSFIYTMGLWLMPVIYVIGGTLLLLYAQNVAKYLVEEAGESSSIEPLPAFSLWIKLIGLYFALGQLAPIGRLWGSLGCCLWASEIRPEAPVTFRTIHELPPEMAHYMRIELFVHIFTLAICVMFIVKSRKIAAKLMVTEMVAPPLPEGDVKKSARED